MRPHLIILGAGRSHGDGLPAGLQRVTLERRVLEWQLEAFAELSPEVSFVGGYYITEVMAQFPRMAYHINPEWRTTGSVASLALALESVDEQTRGMRDLYVVYSDILLRSGLVRSLAFASGDLCCTVAVDTLRMTTRERPPETLLIDGKQYEFVGLVRVPAAIAPRFCDAVLRLAPALRQHHLSHLFAELARQVPDVIVRGVPVSGLWAHVEHGRSVARFVLGSKAATLDRLQNRLARSQILPLAYFTRQDYLHGRDEVLAELLRRFCGERRLVVRSSATDEDGFAKANAGRYCTVLNVPPELRALEVAIERVFASYEADDPMHEVLVQPQLENVRASGVIFTRVLETGAPYWVINYAEGSDTTAITSGASRKANKLYISRMAPPDVRKGLPPLARRLVEAAEEIEACACHDALDIEFALDQHDRLITLQVRPLVVDDAHQDRNIDVAVADCLAGIHTALREASAPPPGQVGTHALWSVMADWNPAEIIGLTPAPLALDLYRYIITDSVWAVQRQQVGYRDLRGWPLVRSFGGQAFVDVRASINSFLPASLPAELAHRLADHALDLLRANRALHDKLEFELMPTCLDFAFGHWRTRYLQAGVCDVSEIWLLQDGLRNVTRNIVSRARRDLAAVQALEARCAELEVPRAPLPDWLRHVLSVCSETGALLFAHLARAAFVSAALLRSAVRLELITETRRAALMESLPGVGRMLTESAAAVRAGRLSRDALIARFGHLRPGTYDISTPAYRDRPEEYLDPIIATAQASPPLPFEWTPRERRSLDEALLALDIGLDAGGLLEYTRIAVYGREYAKFVFTRLLCAVLDFLAAKGSELGVPPDRLDCMPLDAWLDQSVEVWGNLGARDMLVARTEQRHRQHRLSSLVLLPPVLASAQEVYAFEMPPSEPTYITTRRALAPIKVLSQGPVVQRDNVEGRIVAVANADPGFDYLFALGIKGLITAFGGPNSHMAVRASEFSIPAVIGIGEEEFARLRDGMQIEIDCQRRRWQQVGTESWAEAVCVS